jgi:hypothetical protein
MKIRKSAVAGRFYPASKESIIDQLETIRNNELPNINLELKDHSIIGGVVPHAGYMFSASQAVHFFEIIKQSQKQYDTIVIVNPNHTGMGHDMAFDSNEAWETPLGLVELDVEFGKKLGIPISEIEQKREHSCEVMLPFLQYFLNYEFKIAPITLSRQTFKNAKSLAGKIQKAAQKLKREILFIASSDFSHFLSPEKGKEMDEHVLRNIILLESQNIEKEVVGKNISVCGYGPIMTLIEYSKLLTEKPKVDILKMGHSGEIIPSSEVVNYISLLFTDLNKNSF